MPSKSYEITTLNDARAQVLANLKCLYGLDFEVLTFTIDHKYQAVAVSFDAFNRTWIKFVHSEPDTSSTQDAIQSLLRKTERELAKHFSANGISIPFEGNIVETLTLRRGQPRSPGTESSFQSEFSFIATPKSSLSVENVPKEPIVEEPAAEEPLPIFEATSFNWGSWGYSKKHKKKKTAGVTFNESPKLKEPWSIDCPVEELKAEEISTLKQPSDAMQDDDDFWSPRKFSKKDKKRRKKASLPECLVEAEVCARPASPEYLAEEVCERIASPEYPIEEPCEETPAESFEYPAEAVACEEPCAEPQPELENYYSVVETVPTVDEPAPEPTPEPKEKVKDDDWESWDITRRMEKFSVEIEEPKADEPPPLVESQVIDDDIWGTWDAMREKHKKKKHQAWDTSVEPAPKPVANDGRWAWPTKKDMKNWVIEAELETSARTPQPQPVRNGQTVVFSIRYPNETNSKPLQVMLTLADNTRAAIFDAVNSYLDSKSPLVRRQVQRKLEIMYGVGKNGDVDLSALEENPWPEYLEYFGQYTKFPELTVDVVN